MTGSTANPEPWSETQDEDHPILWTPADQSGPDVEASRYCTLGEAGRRLANYGIAGGDAQRATDLLLQGHKLRTPFAFYQLPDAVPA